MLYAKTNVFFQFWTLQSTLRIPWPVHRGPPKQHVTIFWPRILSIRYTTFMGQRRRLTVGAPLCKSSLRPQKNMFSQYRSPKWRFFGNLRFRGVSCSLIEEHPKGRKVVTPKGGQKSKNRWTDRYKICTSGAVHDVITRPNFIEDWLRGFGMARVEFMHFPLICFVAFTTLSHWCASVIRCDLMTVIFWCYVMQHVWSSPVSSLKWIHEYELPFQTIAYSLFNSLCYRTSRDLIRWHELFLCCSSDLFLGFQSVAMWNLNLTNGATTAIVWE